MESLNQSEVASNPEVQKLAEQYRRAVDAVAGSDPSFAERERAALAVGNAITNQDLLRDLQRRADRYREYEYVKVNGQLYKRHEEGEIPYHSLVGDLKVRRPTYRAVGMHNGPTIVPLELDAGLLELATPQLAQGVAQGYAKHDMRSHHEDLIAAGRLPPSRTALETLAKRTAAEVHAAVPHIEPYLRRHEDVPPEVVAVSLGLDRTSVPRAESPSPDHPARPHERTRPYERTPPPPFVVVWRMAYVGTVTLVDADGIARVIRRYTATAEEGPERIVRQMLADVRAALRRRPDLTVGVVQDGAPEMWNLLRPALTAEPMVSTWVEAVDKYHLLERLGAALALVEPDPKVRDALYTSWKDELDVRDSAIDSVERWLTHRYSALEPGDAAEKLWEHLTYLRNNKDRMRYVTLAVRGLPVGSGVTESAAKTVIGTRTKHRGQHWSEPGLRGVLALRAIHASDRFPAFWRSFSRRYTARVALVP